MSCLEEVEEEEDVKQVASYPELLCKKQYLNVVIFNITS